MTKILLVNPHETEQSGFTNPPLGLLYIAGILLKNGFEVRVVDGCIEGRPGIEKAMAEMSPDIVGITCLTPARKKSLEVARLAKSFNPAIKVVLGGAHATIMYRQLIDNYPFIDYIVLGEGELTFLDIARGEEPARINGLVYRDGGHAVKTPPRKYIADLDDIPFPAWHFVDLKKYPVWGKGVVNGVDLEKEPRISVIFSRGCKGHCDFCSTWWIWKGWRHRSPGNMVAEMKMLYHTYGVRHFCFADDALTIDREATIGLCDEIARQKLKIAFCVTTRTDCVDEVVLHKLKEAGCYEIAYGVETGSPVLLDMMGKENDIATSEKAIRLTKEAGIKATALIIVGNIGESETTVRETVDFLRRTQPDEVGCIGGLWVLPGTKVYRECVKKEFINDDFWLSDEPFKVYTFEHSLEEIGRMQKRVTCYNMNARLRGWKAIVSGNIKKLRNILSP